MPLATPNDRLSLPPVAQAAPLPSASPSDSRASGAPSPTAPVDAHKECNNVGIARLSKRDHAAACTLAIESGHYRDSRLAYLYLRRGHSYWELQDYARALADLERAFEINPHQGLYDILLRGKARLKVGNRQGAIQDMQHVLELFDSFGDTTRDANAGPADEARKLLQDLGVATRPTQPLPPSPLRAASGKTSACDRLVGKQVTVSGIVSDDVWDELEIYAPKKWLLHDNKSGCPIAVPLGCRFGQTIAISGRLGPYDSVSKSYGLKIPKGTKARCQAASAVPAERAAAPSWALRVEPG